MKEFIEYIVKNLVDSPESVEVQCTENGHHLSIDIKVDSDDVGKVIGRHGSVIQALRTVAATIAMRFNCHVRINVVE